MGHCLTQCTLKALSSNNGLLAFRTRFITLSHLLTYLPSALLTWKGIHVSILVYNISTTFSADFKHNDFMANNILCTQ
jgi:hypothetical protein